MKRAYFALTLALFFIVYAAAGQAKENSAGELILEDKFGNAVPTLILDTHIDAEVNGMISTMTIRQNFKNESDDWVNGRYVFPLPENAAVDGLKLIVGEREIIGQIKEKLEAKKIFSAAKKAGKRAGLLEQQRPNLFSISVANVPPREEVTAVIRLVDHVKYDNASFSLRLPTTLTPRYFPGSPASLSHGHSGEENMVAEPKIEESQELSIDSKFGWASNTDIVGDASLISPPQEHLQNARTPNQFSLNLRINSGVQLERVNSASHPIKVNKVGSTSAEITLANGKENMDSDLTIIWKPVASNTPRAAIFQQKLDEEYFSMTMLLPPTTNSIQALPKEVIFIVDSSGSMGGNSMQQAKESLYLALDKLNVNDRFNIVDFDSNFSVLFSDSIYASSANIGEAKYRINQLQADGGTEMFAPLKHVLSQPTPDGYLKQVIFLTDGAVGNEKQLFELIRKQLGDARLFTVGIGYAPNAFFMNKAAQFGRGTYTFIANAHETVPKMNQLFTKINSPLAKDLGASFITRKNKSANVEQFPQAIPDLYAGEPVLVFAKSDSKITKVEVRGSLLNKQWTRTIRNGAKTNSASNLDAIWARKKVDALMDDLYTGTKTEAQIKPDVVALGIDHHIVTKFTSFVAVEAEPSKPKHKQAKNKAVKNLMPKGSTMQAPQTATPSTLIAVLGSIMSLLGLLMRRRGAKQTSFFRLKQLMRTKKV